MKALFFWADYGAGPGTLVDAVGKAIRIQAPETEVLNVELGSLGPGDIVRRFIASEQNWRYRRAYGERSPLTDRIRSSVLGIRYRRTFPHRERAMLQRIRDFEPDVIVAVQPAMEVVARLRRRGLISTPLVHAHTDVTAERFDLSQPCEMILAGSEDAARNLAAWGVPPPGITVTGVPIDPLYETPPSPDSILRELQLPQVPGRPTVLHVSASTLARRHDVLKRLTDVTVPSDIIVVGAKSSESMAGGEFNGRNGHRVRVLDFVDRIPELMAAADVVITKPGGLTTAQALACRCALVLGYPLPMFEQGNLDYFVDSGAAVRYRDDVTLPWELDAILADPLRLRRMQEAAGRVARPTAAREAADVVLRVAEEGIADVLPAA